MFLGTREVILVKAVNKDAEDQRCVEDNRQKSVLRLHTVFVYEDSALPVLSQSAATTEFIDERGEG